MGDFSMLGTRIKELRSKLGKTQRDFANFVGCTAATLSAYENGSKSPSLEIVKSIAEKCHVSIDWLCGLTDKENYDDDIKTYADVFRTISKLLNILYPSGCKWTCEIENFCATIKTSDSTTVHFIADWIQIQKLYDKKMIDKSAYEILLREKLKEFKNISCLIETEDETLHNQ